MLVVLKSKRNFNIKRGAIFLQFEDFFLRTMLPTVHRSANFSEVYDAISWLQYAYGITALEGFILGNVVLLSLNFIQTLN